MTRKQAAVFFFAVTIVFTVFFIILTLHSHTRFPALTNADAITAEVLHGKDVWHRNNCVMPSKSSHKTHGRGWPWPTYVKRRENTPRR